MQEIRVRSLGGEDPLEEEMATHSSILAWEIPQTEEPGGLRLWDPEESDMTERLTHTHTHTDTHKGKPARIPKPSWFTQN